MDLDPHRQHALGLDSDVQVGRLAGDREVAAEAAPHDCVAGAYVQLLGLFVGNADQPDADAVLTLEVLERAHHPREPALHVIRTAAEQPVALHTRLELLRPPRNDIEVPVEDHAGPTLA